MKNRITILTAVCLLAAALTAQAREDRAVFNTAWNNLENKTEVIKPGGAWVPYPAYKDRAAWDKLTEGYKEALTALGDKWIDFKWVVMPATIYLEYEKTKDRGLLDIYDHPNREALANLILAELGEGKGRLIPQIINGVYYAAERMSWNHAQHQTAQHNHRTLPVPDDRVVSLNSAVWAANVAIALHFFHEEFDKYDPSISKTVYHALEINQFEPYLTKRWSWLGLNRKNGQSVNNWNCFCNYYSLLASMFAEQDPERLQKTMDLVTYSFDQYLDFVGIDGATEEGSFYWTMATSKVYEFARLLHDISGGKMDTLKDMQIRNMSSYMVNCYIGDGWILDVSDADARIGPDVMYRDVFYRYGVDTDSPDLSNLAIAMMADPATKSFRPCQLESLHWARELYRSMESLRYNQRLKADQKARLEEAGGDWEKMKMNLTKGYKNFWYNDTELAILRQQKGWYVGAKGGHNAESHGHLDVGSAVVFVDECPVFIDPGVETYSNTTFGSLRSKQWWYTTSWHTLPLINGERQFPGRNAHASNCKYDYAKQSFSCDIATAYPEEAGVKSWTRTYALLKDGVSISDKCRLNKRTAADVMNFVADNPVILPGETVDGYTVKPGEVIILSQSYDGKRRVKVRISYPSSLTPAVEKKEMMDPRFIGIWHSDLYRLYFTTAENAPLSAGYEFKLSRM